MKKLLFIYFILALINVYASIGKITFINGTANILREEKSFIAKLGDDILSKDIINTEENSKLQIIFNDKTVVTIGNKSKFSIDDYYYDMNNSKESKLDMNFSNGFFKTITGKIGKINPSKFKLNTKSASIGIRGTQIIMTTDSVAGDFIACTSGEISVTSNLTGNSVIVPSGNFTKIVPGVNPTIPETYSSEQLDNLSKNTAGEKSEEIAASETENKTTTNDKTSIENVNKNDTATTTIAAQEAQAQADATAALAAQQAAQAAEIAAQEAQAQAQAEAQSQAAAALAAQQAQSEAAAALAAQEALAQSTAAAALAAQEAQAAADAAAALAIQEAQDAAAILAAENAAAAAALAAQEAQALADAALAAQEAQAAADAAATLAAQEAQAQADQAAAAAIEAEAAAEEAAQAIIDNQTLLDKIRLALEAILSIKQVQYDNSILKMGYWTNPFTGKEVSTYVEGTTTPYSKLKDYKNNDISAQYNGVISAIHTKTDGSNNAVGGNATFDVDFGNKKLDGTFVIGGTDWKTKITDISIDKYSSFSTTSIENNGSSTTGITGTIAGKFYGPNAENIGGSIDMNSTNNGSVKGSFATGKISNSQN